MRVGGLASGIDTDSLIRELMNAERIPLQKLEQDKIEKEWQRDAFRDINKHFSELKDALSDFRLRSSTLMGNKVTSSMADAVSATANASAPKGSYRISVEELATNEVRVRNELSAKELEEAIQHTLEHQDGEIKFTTYDENGEVLPAHSIKISADDSIQDIVKKINDDDAPVRAFYDENSKNFILETTQTGKYNTANDGDEITFDSESFFGQIFNVDDNTLVNKTDATDAKFQYNGVEFTSKENNYTIHNINFNFHNVTDGDAVLQVDTNTDEIIDNVKDLVDKYNALVGVLQSSQNEPVYRDYPPLTEEQMEEMTDRQIELWEEKAKSGLLKGERIISNTLNEMRSTMYSQVDNDGAFAVLTQIGISTTESYLDGGILEIDEDKLREAIEEDASNVYNLLVNNSDGAERGLLNRLDDTLNGAIDRIEERAGKGSYTNQQFTLGKELDNIDDRIEAFERRLQKTEDRYWRQFNAMEQAISMMNNQSAMLMGFTNPNM